LSGLAPPVTLRATMLAARQLPRARPVRRARAGLGLVEVVLLISLGAVVLAAGLPAFVRALRLSKIAEASEQLRVIQQGIAGYYAGRHEVDGSAPLSRCFPRGAGPWPPEPTVEPRMLEPAVPESDGEDDGATWDAIGFRPTMPLRFSYSILPSQPGCTPEGVLDEGRAVVLRAEGDLDGDGKRSLFERTLRTTASGLAVEPLLTVVDRTE
jgi:type II secretory pathway pseudopilin PulG